MGFHSPSSGGGTPGGSDTQVQYNDDGSFAGALVYYTRDTEENESQLALGEPGDGSFIIKGRTGVGSGDSGTALVIRGGDTTTGGNDGGGVSIIAGQGDGGGENGTIDLFSADESNSFGVGDGYIYFANAADGSYIFYNTNFNAVILDTETVASSDKTFTFPNTTGTIDVTASSKRFKKDIKDLSFNASELVNQLKPREFTYKKDYSGRKAVGLIAEEVEKIDPRLVMYDKEGKPKGVYYTELTAVLVKALQEANERISKLEKRLERG